MISSAFIAKTLITTASDLKRSGVVVFLGLLIALSAVSPKLYAHGGAAVEKDKCSFRTEGHMMHFTAYQPTETNRKELCKDIPATANTIFVLDIVDEVLRTVPVKIDIEREVSGAFGAFISIPAQSYETGSTSFDLSDLEPGKYRILASLEAAESHMHTEEQKLHHKPGYLDFSIKAKSSTQEESFFEQYSWIFYVLALIVFLFFISNKYRTKKN